jgi:phospholipid/cholesterol/gamma-HCH transport system substrate-binding protein
MFATRRGRRIGGYVAAAVVLALVASGALWWVFRDLGAKQITAYFSETVGVYPGSDLRVLGVKVGTVDTVSPVGTQVRVTMTLDHDVTVPEDVDAVVVSPSVVSDRYVQLSPVYNGGPQLLDHAVIPAARTATPVELDQLYRSLDQLATALGPDGANAHGALSDLVNTGADNLGGNGQAIATMIQQLGSATRTLSGSSANLFGTVDNLQQFTTMLKDNDGQVRNAENQLASVSSFLAADRDDLAGALDELATALQQVRGFIQDNRERIRSNVAKLASITQILVNQRASLAESLDVFPLAATNVLNAYDPANGTLDGRADLNEFSTAPPPTSTTGTDLVPVPSGSAGNLPDLPLPAAGPVYGLGQDGGR